LNLEIKDNFKNQKNDFSKGFDEVLGSNLNLILIRTKANAFYSYYKSKAIHQYKNKCMAG
jgi:hypothetical protein